MRILRKLAPVAHEAAPNGVLKKCQFANGWKLVYYFGMVDWGVRY
jgi:hypothetical protein